MTNALQKTNAKLISLFLFQYTLTIPLMRYISSSIIIAVTSLFLIVIMLLYNKRIIINRRAIYFISYMLIVIFLKILLGSDIDVLFCFICFALPCAFVFSLNFDKTFFLITSCNIAIVNLLLVSSEILFSDYNYMRFGYGLLPSLIFLYLKITNGVQYNNFNRWWNKYKLIDILLFLCGFFEVLFLGNRGAIFSLMFYIFLDAVLIRSFFSKRNFIILISALVGLSYLTFILDFINDLGNRYALFNRNVRQFIRFLNEGFDAASSGRSILFYDAIERIKRHPIFGNDIVINTEKLDFFHNIFLQVAHDLGLIGLFFLIVFIVYLLLILNNNYGNILERNILCILFSISFGRLMFSSTFWMRPEFWMLVFMFITCLSVKINLREH